MSRESAPGRYIGNPLFEATPHSQPLTHSNSAVTCASQAANPGSGPGNYYNHAVEATAR